MFNVFFIIINQCTDLNMVASKLIQSKLIGGDFHGLHSVCQ